jgi:hypothetical protein
MESEGARRKSRIWTHPARLPSRKRFEGHGIARTTPLTSLDHPSNRSNQEGERAPEPTGAERDGDIPGQYRKRDEPHGRQQVATHLHTGAGANPQGGATPRRGNENPAGSHRTQLHRCQGGCPIERNPGFGLGFTRWTGQGPVRCFGNGGALRRVPLESEREWTVPENGSTGAILGFRSLRRGERGNLERGVSVLPVHRGNPASPLGSQVESVDPSTGRLRATGDGEGGPGNRTTCTRHPRGPGGESCQGRGGRREEAIYLQLGRGAHVFTEQSAKINHWIRKTPARRPPPNDRRTPKGGRSREASARDSAQHP